MKRLGILGLSAMLAAGLASSPGSAVAQQKSPKEQLVGTWILVSCDLKAADFGITRLAWSSPSTDTRFPVHSSSVAG
jgi:hypothetical protein